MELVRVDTLRAYELIWEKITTLELAPGAAISEGQLAEELRIGLAPVREAIRLLAHENLVVVTPRHGLYVADVNLADLEQISEMRLSLESLAARLAVQRATPDDMAVLEALRQQQALVSAEDTRRLFDLDHKFHQAVTRAAQNKYLAQTLDHLFGLSRRLWYLAWPQVGQVSIPAFLPSAVEQHVELVKAIQAGDADRAEQVMRAHVQDFYNKVREVLYRAQAGG